ncbi:hypothetical protein JMM81_07010 [Bacillus sp. V3B]|uniref:hypothetical protein n=1 Tax=Bacillus sp. V3B TaxID=2804915 RepID=UPI00210AD394|nr:hypothetical protein [Bacillus sp. V3B]MCQ6274721.1 hypothetical protein [Bacillus sp. V3B]
MKVFDDIVSKFNELESKAESLASVVNHYGFETVDKQQDDNYVTGDTYEIFRAQYLSEGYVLVASITTRDKYRLGGNDDEPYTNTLELFKNGELITKEAYTYWK